MGSKPNQYESGAQNEKIINSREKFGIRIAFP